MGIGAALLKGEPCNLQSIAYISISRKLVRHEVRQSVVEKECIAIMWALDSLKYNLLGWKFILETDYHAMSVLQGCRT